MTFKSDIDIAQACKMQKITEIAKLAGIDEEYLELYGNYKAKVNYKLLKDINKKHGKLILVTAINPTPQERARRPRLSVLQMLFASSVRTQ